MSLQEGRPLSVMLTDVCLSTVLRPGQALGTEARAEEAQGAFPAALCTSCAFIRAAPFAECRPPPPLAPTARSSDDQPAWSHGGPGPPQPSHLLDGTWRLRNPLLRSREYCCSKACVLSASAFGTRKGLILWEISSFLKSVLRKYRVQPSLTTRREEGRARGGEVSRQPGAHRGPSESTKSPVLFPVDSRPPLVCVWS